MRRKIKHCDVSKSSFLSVSCFIQNDWITGKIPKTLFSSDGNATEIPNDTDTDDSSEETLISVSADNLVTISTNALLEVEENIDNGIPEESNEQPENGNEEKDEVETVSNEQTIEIVSNSGNVYGSSNPNEAPESNQAVTPEDPTATPEKGGNSKPTFNAINLDFLCLFDETIYDYSGKNDMEQSPFLGFHI